MGRGLCACWKKSMASALAKALMVHGRWVELGRTGNNRKLLGRWSAKPP
jgi:hypothetical protein